VLTAVRFTASTGSDVPNGSSAFEMYRAVRCHIPEDLSLRAAEFVVQLKDFLNGEGSCGDWFWAAHRFVVVLLYCCTVLV
jgi:hypothetical protein